MRYLRQILTGIFLLLALLLLAFWLNQLDQSPATGNSNPDFDTPADDASEMLATSPRSETIIGVTPTRSETSEIRATNTANPGTTMELESIPGPTASTTSSSLSLTPSALPSPIDVKESPSTRPTATKTNQLDSVDRACPEPSPAKPDYYHYYLSGNPWPEPRPDGGLHMWLSKPFQGSDRLLITEWFPYGYDVAGRYLIHNGIDMAEPQGTALLAVADGTVVVSGDDVSALYGWRCNWYGQLVVIELDDRWQGMPVYVLYGHVQNISVEQGQRISRGQEVAEVGMGGAATRPHLHLEVRVGENVFEATRNPLLWIAPPLSRGVIVGRVVDPEGRPWQGVVVTAISRSEDTGNYTTWTYLGDPQLLVNPDETLAENFVIGDVEPGAYEILVTVQGETYRVELVVEPGELSVVELTTGPFKTPTMTPQPAG